MNPGDPLDPYGQPYGGSGQPYGGNPYGGNPGGPPPWHPEAFQAAPERPAEVTRSFQLWLGTIGIGLVSMLVSFLMPDPMADQAASQLAAEMRAAGLQMTEAEAVSFLNTVIITTIFITIAFMALHVFFVFRMRDGRNWARITMTVIAVLVLPFTLLNIFATGMGLTAALFNVLYLGLVVAAIYFMWTSRASEYFRAHTLFRQRN